MGIKFSDYRVLMEEMGLGTLDQGQSSKAFEEDEQNERLGFKAIQCPVPNP